MRFFNTAGPIKPDRHYCVPPLERLDLDAVLALIRDEKYFVLHAPRQTGKTSALLALCDLLNAEGGISLCVCQCRGRASHARKMSNRSCVPFWPRWHFERV